MRRSWFERTHPPKRRKSRRHQRPIRRLYVNAYAVDLCYGGGEEGGWWYDAGEPLASVELNTRHSADRRGRRKAAIIARLSVQFAHIQTERSRTSAAGGTDLEIYIEDHPAAAFPERTPTYE